MFYVIWSYRGTWKNERREMNRINLESELKWDLKKDRRKIKEQSWGREGIYTWKGRGKGWIIIIIGIQPLGRFGQRPELSQATGMALVRCILGKFLGVVCHCFPPLLDVPTFATRCHEARDPSGGKWNCGRECCPVILPKWRLPRHLGIFYMPQI